MNLLIQELAEQAGFYVAGGRIYIPSTSEEITTCQKKFAELIVGECIRKINDIAESSNNPQPIYRVAVDLLEHFGVEE
jgi:hypothetical protein